MQGPKVLLVNDDPASLFALESLLVPAAGRGGYQLMTASSGQQALRAVLRQDFAVILLDVSMPGMDGFETAEAIHAHPRSAGVPIIFITAHYADEIYRLKAYQNGAADYLFTPVIPQILHTKVAVFVEMSKKNLLLRQQAEQLAKLNQDLRLQRLQDLERINRELEQEIAERKQAEQRAHELSTRDALTGLVNRRSLIQQLEHAVAGAERSGAECALLFLDLDKFKPINDQHGHEVGDELLRQVAARLLAAVRAADVVARLGGDEFVVLIEGRAAAANAARVARKIEQAHSKPYLIDGRQIHAACSVGIALYPQDGRTARTLMKHADLAMYHAKQDPAARIKFFHEELNQREQERARWTQELRQALLQRQLELRYQPLVDVAGGQVRAAEAQLYWRHPRHGELAAAAFLPAVQERALLDQVDAWACACACAQAARWRRARSGPPVVSLNLAAQRLTPELAQRLLFELKKHKLTGGGIELELNAALLFGSGPQVDAVLRQLQGAGVRLALDDFGNAPLSLADCKRYRLATLKIDSAFVRAIGNDQGGTDVMAAVVHLGRALDMRVVALGVDHARQLDALRALGCDWYQGDLFCPALPPAALEQQLRQGVPAASATRAQLAPSLLNHEDFVDEQHD